MRFIADLANWDGSFNNIDIGESGQILSRHYKDQWDAYYVGRSFPMQFEKVDGEETRLVPVDCRSEPVPRRYAMVGSGSACLARCLWRWIFSSTAAM